ncbi:MULTISPECIES: DUF7192 family protein [Streptomyces]|uniref:DUF7192 domain-containing protein n=1 Tax=Streptomyces harbinensis TaxID=1176198 RepID=A0A1I6PSG2_9ACTN|nr:MULTISPECIES: hypothetical protein [Streptomyces]SFS43139.1 hypothetical protein SAMN05444716_101696 [Streptomyces harbinensis]
MSAPGTYESRPETRYELPPLWSWQEFIDRAKKPVTIPNSSGRREDPAFAGAGWEETLRLARDGWSARLPEVEADVAALRTGSGRVRTTVLVPRWDVTGSEVDIGAYLAGEPECMIDAEPQQATTHGRVVSFLIPASYENFIPHQVIRNRGLALSALCSSIIMAGHSVEIWSGFGGRVADTRASAVARVISPAEPLDLGRLIFALAHPAMLRRLWHSIWDSTPEELARLIHSNRHCYPPFSSYRDDLPDGVEDPYILPALKPGDDQWNTLESSLARCREIFADLGLLVE